MILREFGVRYGRTARRALPRPGTAHHACPVRALSTELTTLTGGTGLTALDIASGTSKTQLPAIFSANSKATRKKRPEAIDKTAELYHQGQDLKKQIGSLGSTVQSHYRPGEVFFNPPGPKDVTLELLMASQAHMGHHASLWNPANARYIYGIRQGIHIISLEETAAHLRRAARVVEEIAYRGGLILFVGTRPGHTQIVTQAAKLARGCHLFTKWTPGSITNSDVILNNMQMRMVDELDRPLDGYDRHLNECAPLRPDLVICLNPLENYTILHECSLVNIPTIGVVDTNTEPSWVTYVIPANDDSLRCLAVIGSVLGKAGEAGHNRRLSDARLGIVKWETPIAVQSYLARLQSKRQKEAERTAQYETDNDKIAEEAIAAKEAIAANDAIHAVDANIANVDDAMPNNAPASFDP